MCGTLSKNSYANSGVDNDFGRETWPTIVTGRGLMAYRSGKGFGEYTDPLWARNELERMELPIGFEPNFSSQNLTRTYAMDHTLLGPTKVKVFEAQYGGRVIEWHVANDDRTDTVWLDRVIYKEGHTNEFGVRSEMILAGALNAKPVDYDIQLIGMEPGHDYVDIGVPGYSSVKPTLDRYPWVKRYRHAKAQNGAA